MPNESEDFDELDLSSEPEADLTSRASSGSESSSRPSRARRDDQVRVWFHCCSVYWRFPIPADVIQGQRDSWFVSCPRCGARIRLP